ncbi:MAG: tRNA uridine(34) 5-carboxymethylaminomethyl modification radical SAM/GNAT enzyme Elp3 [Candidatus Magasanikbacteria bacterium CG10_big_fil_rev_8_21_14_0_10_40_10]|uniref:tRNA carboxymethyluridine synthase n=1 Tax=Candidatus Magasanikbacteria bacterium CG10_big_fil_rev_8_21_14_0_10_40_10 TaxID=1974648 RepID=A0A2M6W2V0_9BACT|nr:MAG: tRNA uridine(34) 5-carboxymethylaminomethyl modification radical SAM/GNAT enzyme Elp3 [Candidatus Magasanikbacteria bacterium CG10_big_fil_rev_8_21_14_0_10_40_10]
MPQDILDKMLIQLTKEKILDEKKLDKFKRAYLRANRQIKSLPNKSRLLEVYHKLRKLGKIKPNTTLEKLCVKRAVRTQSGVTIVTVLTKPFPCPGKCVYCPSEPGMPKSYISDEPAAARALKLNFDPFEQTFQRLRALKNNGHPTDKVELIVKGGSWNAYPLAYQYWFILRCFEACNNKKTSALFKPIRDLKKIKKLLDKEQKKNESSARRVIGLTLETRPDLINNATVKIMRELGCTRIEMGAQTTDEKILKIVKRGHGVKEIKTATALLKNYGFKVDYHLMPQLPASTPAKDLRMMRQIFEDPSYRPDMIKIYPCTVIANTPLYDMLRAGQYRPYSDKKLVEMLIKLKSDLPYYVRISRLIRDIPSHHVQAGNKMTNLRQLIQNQMAQKNLACHCLRCREVGHQIAPDKISPPKLFIDKYEASGGTEYFLSWEDKNRQIVYAFCRLRLNSCPPAIYPAFIRELHTYGQQLAIGQRQNQASQHKGLGKKLIQEAEKICQTAGLKQLAVISGIGVRGYYRHLGYRLQNGYMVKKIIQK